MSVVPQQLDPDPSLLALMKACEKVCVADCCGIDAFDFSPLHAASHLSAFTGQISESDVASLVSSIDELLAAAAACEPNEEGFVCGIAGTNQFFTREDIRNLGEQLKSCVRLAPKVLDLADRVREEGT